MKPDPLSINDTLVRRLITDQFPQWEDLAIRPVTPGGWDNRTFRLGELLSVRLPSAPSYEAQVEKEQAWLPRLAPLLPLLIPTPLAMGKATDFYPFRWSVYRWIEGDTASSAPVADLSDFAASLARFLIALQGIDATGGPVSGPHNFHRGGALAIYDGQMRQAISILKGKVDSDAATEIWEQALSTAWKEPPVWVHGDVSAGNLLLQKRKLSAVIDFGQLGIGDPACDLSITWAFFNNPARRVFRTMLPLDTGTWARGRGWALWKAMIVASGLVGTNSLEAAQAWRVINEVLANE